MPADEHRPGGLFATLRRMADAALGLAQNRARLFAIELEAERFRLLESLLKIALALGVMGVGVFLGALTLALFAWQQARYAGLLLVTLLFLLAGVFLLWRLRCTLRGVATVRPRRQRSVSGPLSLC